MASNKKKVGVAWFKHHHYDQIRRTFLDGQTMPPTYEEWIKTATAFCDQITEAGREAVRVGVEPEEFKRWCRDNQFRTDARGRDCYLKLMTYRIAMGQHAAFADDA